MAKTKVYIHPTAEVSQKAKIGSGTKIWHQAQVRENTKIGRNCNIGKAVYIDTNVKIGNNVKIQNFVSVYDGVTVEDDVFIGPSATFTNDLYPRSRIWSRERRVKTHVKKGASIGANATILCGLTIGEHSMVGAGSVVTSDVPNHALVLGNPARLKGFVCICGWKVEEYKVDEKIVEFKCPKCRKITKIPSRDYYKKE